MITRKIAWKGLYHASVEKCTIKIASSGNIISGKILGTAEQKSYTLTYCIVTDPNWKTSEFEVTREIANSVVVLKGKRNNTDSWEINNDVREDLTGCIDIDISLTPFTNSLPINRLNLNIGDEKIIKVVYVDVLELKINMTKQKYFRVSKSVYKYENVPNDFEAHLTIDDSGLVTHYPGLFEKSS